MKTSITPWRRLGLGGPLALAVLTFGAACATTGGTPTPTVPATSDPALAAVVSKRLVGDRTGACFAVAVVTDEATERAFVCADGRPVTRIGPDTAFEIGSVSKTMTAALLASLLEEGEATLDQPLSSLLPDGAEVPTFEGQPILLRHLVTHTSGLPPLPLLPIPNPSDPYASMDPEATMGALAMTRLSTAPGTHFEYSNFASMVLSHAVGSRAGSDFEALVKTRLFEPLGMHGAYVTRPPEGIRPAQGHLSTGAVTSAWNFHPSLAGVGGVRATLDDMIQYVRGNLGLVDAPIRTALLRTHQPIEGATRKMGMNWMIAPLSGREILAHEGGTGGFSSFVAFDPETKRGVVVLSDTSLAALGGLGDLGVHLLDPSMPLGQPRKAIPAPKELLDALVGTYQLQGAMQMTLSQKGGALVIQAQGQPAFEMGYDDRGDFYPLAFDARLLPQKLPDGTYSFTWLQGGGAMMGKRLDREGEPKAALQLSQEELQAYVGEYPLMPSFSLTVTTQDGKLFIQGSGQPPLEVQAKERDVFFSALVAAEIHFERGEDGKVTGLTLLQGGATLRGDRRPPAP